MSIRDGMRGYYELCGLRGVSAIATHRLIGWPNKIGVKPPNSRNRLYLRVRTSDISVYKEILLGTEYHLDLAFSPRTIVDAGANIGMASIYFAERYPAATIIAVEPEPSNFELLVKNVQPYPRIIPLQAALWNRDGEVSISQPNLSPEDSGHWAFVTREGAGVMVRAITLETLMKELDLPGIDVLKVDIEGAEIEVFEDPSWVDRLEVVMIELHDRLRQGCSEAVERAMRGFDRSERSETTFFVRKSATRNSDISLNRAGL